MNLDTAAQVGEALGGIAILLTMLFGLRQVVEWNQTRRNEITQRIAEHLGTTLVQRAMGVIANDLDEEFTQEEVLALSREQKNSINAILVGLNSHAIMTFQGHLTLEILSAYYQPYLTILEKRIRKLAILLNSLWLDSTENQTNSLVGPFDWVIWLLDRIEEQPSETLPVYELHKDWKA